jgi:hypothetical protein
MNSDLMNAAKLATTIAVGYVVGASVVSYLIKKKVIVAKKIKIHPGVQRGFPNQKGKMKFIGFGGRKK